MNQNQFQAAAGISAGVAVVWYPHVTAAMQKFGITKTADQAMFIAQVAHESGGFTALVESFNYSVQALIQTFVPNRLGMGQAKQLGRQVGEKTVPLARQAAIANLVYYQRNGNTGPGDGWKFRGRGLIQITFLSNYLECGKALGVDLVETPELLEKPEYAALSAAWFFASRGCMKYTGDVERVTLIINGGRNGLDDRRARHDHAIQALS
ncbi:glycoside hydrolase family 19 protein [Dickeya solani]|uniref:Glycoside hydrolase family 19 protein n=1 Tax=Dickeya solani TaxID=1089444 RepID=A0ABU4EMM9_9GAMM|nr:glycoside hydrolase family 19 protein [Dickeya solani]MCA6998203.1 glycoside hydrolase family 19 protein [Dickeya solani]MDV6997166.1 glycoside hydrolase family 19 protein [Dickeya solani]MDV7004477.1 glycoside hydrolase family 19 protein [Dickeya solani]MDV7040361.1 glycoside hydrolase family 19 protein [Dickeya solani]MDV7044812.1 glycoside hydrolase family 19 protein [Dickeya solani]